MANISIKLLEPNSTIVKKINIALAKEVNKKWTKYSKEVAKQIRPVVSAALYSSPEISSLSGGVLRIDFGLTSNPSSEIVNAILNTLTVTPKKAQVSGSNIVGGLTITLQPVDYNNLFSLSVAEQIIEGGSIPWLRWLLTRGNSIIIADFGVEYQSGEGRSGGGTMSSKQRPFKVNSKFAGTIDDNFITRAISNVAPEINSAIKKAMT